MSNVYACPQGHVTPAADVRARDLIVPCPHLIAARMQCGAKARRVKEAAITPVRPVSTSNEGDTR